MDRESKIVPRRIEAHPASPQQAGSLLVQIGELPVGELAFLAREYRYRTLLSARPERVSALAVAQLSSDSCCNALPSFFEVSLPEGHMRRRLLSRIRAELEAPELALLRGIGRNSIGLLRTLDSRATPSRDNRLTLDLRSMLEMDEEALLDLALARESAWPGISGGFIKLLVTTPPADTEGRQRNWIVKFGDRDHPGICALEQFGMGVAKVMGLPVPDTIVSDDFNRILVERFDIATDGERFGFEDFCSLSNKPAAEKYFGAVERLPRLCDEVCGKDAVCVGQDQLFAQYLLACVIRNSDAHLKNFGMLVKSGGTAEVSPVYDMLSMGVFAPRRNDGDVDDGMALTLEGTRRWPSPRMLSGLARRCNVSDARERWWIGRLESALVQVSGSAVEAAQRHMDDASIIWAVRRMLQLWSLGVRPFNPDVADMLLGLVRILPKIDRHLIG